MKNLSALFIFLGGAAVGVALGVLFAPDKGCDTRQRIARILREKGINLDKEGLDELIDQLTAKITGNGGEE
ncbi:MAG: YtxH domain-containing protein [Coprobacter sp.]|nr:YtxH domain-containing protein [Coprobacter sp.]